MKQRFSIIIACLLLTQAASAQRNLVGSWQGSLSLGGVSLGVIVHVSGAENAYTATMDIPEQGAKGLRVSSVAATADSLFLSVAAANGKARGRLETDTSFSGVWEQGGAVVPMTLTKLAAGQAVAEPSRPQTPKPPFPYESKDVVFTNKDQSIRYGATLTYPKKEGRFPAVLLLTGSGQQNRDEEIFGHKPFAVLADYLTRRGYMVMRVDDRGIGQTSGEIKNATTLDFVSDATTAFDYLKAHPKVNTARLGLLGHSEGGMIAEMLAAQRSDVYFVVLLAAPGQPTIDLMAEQNRMVLTSQGVDGEAAKNYAAMYKQLVSAVVSATTDAKAKEQAQTIVNDWVKETPAPQVAATTGIQNDETKAAYVSQMTDAMRRPWMRYFMQYDPDQYVRKMRAKVLALNGDKDIQVAASANLAALKASLKKSASPAVSVVELKGLNHLFQSCTLCTVAEYGQLEETFSPQALDTIGEWLMREVK